MRILVTGASGFLGGYITARLQADGHEIVAQGATHMPSGLPGTSTVLTGPLEAFRDWDRLLDGVELVIHVAGRAHVLVRAAAGVQEALFEAANETATKRLTEAMTRRGLTRLIHISSIAAKAPADAYSHSKKKGEDVVLDWAAATGSPAIVLRPPILYGPNAPGNLARLARLLRLPLPLPFASLQNRRSLLSVENAADAVGRAVSGEAETKPTIYEICDEEPVSLRDIVVALAQGMDRRLILVPFPPALLRGLIALRSPKVAESLIGDLVLDNSAFRARFGWEPRIDTVGGLIEMGRSLTR